MTETKYLPAEWLDEVIPAPVDHPDDLIKIIDGKCRLVGKYHDGSDDDDYVLDVVEGEFVTFCEHRCYGHWQVTVERDADGEFTFTGDEGIPADANCFVADHDNDTFAETLHEMFAAMAETCMPGEHITGRTFDVHAYHWSDGKPWYFAIVDDSAHFSPPGTFGSEAVH